MPGTLPLSSASRCTTPRSVIVFRSEVCRQTSRHPWRRCRLHNSCCTGDGLDLSSFDSAQTHHIGLLAHCSRRKLLPVGCLWVAERFLKLNRCAAFWRWGTCLKDGPHAVGQLPVLAVPARGAAGPAAGVRHRVGVRAPHQPVFHRHSGKYIRMWGECSYFTPAWTHQVGRLIEAFTKKPASLPHFQTSFANLGCGPGMPAACAAEVAPRPAAWHPTLMQVQVPRGGDGGRGGSPRASRLRSGMTNSNLSMSEHIVLEEVTLVWYSTAWLQSKIPASSWCVTYLFWSSCASLAAQQHLILNPVPGPLPLHPRLRKQLQPPPPMLLLVLPLQPRLQLVWLWPSLLLPSLARCWQHWHLPRYSVQKHLAQLLHPSAAASGRCRGARARLPRRCCERPGGRMATSV